MKSDISDPGCAQVELGMLLVISWVFQSRRDCIYIYDLGFTRQAFYCYNNGFFL